LKHESDPKDVGEKMKVSVPLRGRGLKLSGEVQVTQLNEQFCFRPLAGKRLETRGIWMHHPSNLECFRPLAGKRLETLRCRTRSSKEA
jgi:hypothetical protein